MLTAAFLLIAAAPAAARAGLTPYDRIVESMMDAQGADARFIGRAFGPDPGTALSFRSDVDVAGQSFSYTLVAGSTYLGRSISLTTTGAYVGATEDWNTTTTGALGPATWTGAGAGVFAQDPPHFDVIFDLNPSPDVFDEHSVVTYSQTATRTVSEGTFTNTLNDVTTSTSTGVDNLILQGPDAGKWEWILGPVSDNGHTFGVRSDGFVPFPDGGAGTFQVHVVPEPSSRLLFGSGLLGLLAFRGRPRRLGDSSSATPGAGAT